MTFLSVSFNAYHFAVISLIYSQKLQTLTLWLQYYIKKIQLDYNVFCPAWPSWVCQATTYGVLVTHLDL